ncbi:MAG: YceI family protein [Acidobacteria bacterium]|nr:YceI family protein [Acidobacteriota bacterium]
MKILLTALVASTFAFAACSGPDANTPKASTSEPSTNKPANTANAAAAPSTAAKGEAMEITPANSTVAFVGYKVTGKHLGGFKQFSGTINLVNGKPEESSVSVDMDAKSIFADDPKLTEHLKTKDFFEVEKFPKASFKSTKIESGAKAPDNFTVTGDLEMHGVTKSVSFPAKIDVTDTDVAVKASFSINRKDFGIVYTGPADNLIRDDVSITLDLKTARKK